MSYAILIPAKFQSSRLPGKNFDKIGDKPLIDYTVEVARILGYPTYISTDYEEYVIPQGMKRINRPHIEGDYDMEFVIEHARQYIKEDYIILMQVTSPTRTSKLCQEIVDMHTKVSEGTIKSLVTVNKYTMTPNGYLYIFPRGIYIWHAPLFVYTMNPEPDIDWIWDFRIAEAMKFGNYC